MPLATTDDLKAVPTIAGAYTDEQMAAMLAAAQRVCQSWTKQNLEEGVQTEYYDGTGLPELVLRQRPVRLGTGAGLLTVKVDQTGYYGHGVTPFADDAWTHGTDYVLAMDDAGYSKSGMLRRIGSSGAAGESLEGWWPTDLRRGTLTARPAPYWPRGMGNVKVTYTSGYAVAPADLTSAVVSLACWLLRNVPFGAQGSLMTETFIDTSYGLGMNALRQGRPELGSVDGILARYREVSIGIGMPL